MTKHELEELKKYLVTKIEKLEKALEKAHSVVHSEFCGDKHHEYCQEIDEMLR